AIFFNHKIGDSFGLQRVFGFALGFARILPEVLSAIDNLHGQWTTDLQIVLQRDLTIGSHTFPRGTTLHTGLDVEAGASFPLGLQRDGNVTCTICHVTLDSNGNQLLGAPNSDLNAALLIALAPNTASGFARLSLNALSPEYAGTKQIIDNTGQL